MAEAIVEDLTNRHLIENIMEQHHYTDTSVKTAAAAVNAGTCLEDANLEDNVFSHIGEAVKTVFSYPLAF